MFSVTLRISSASTSASASSSEQPSVEPRALATKQQKANRRLTLWVALDSRPFSVCGKRRRQNLRTLFPSPPLLSLRPPLLPLFLLILTMIVSVFFVWVTLSYSLFAVRCVPLFCLGYTNRTEPNRQTSSQPKPNRQF